MPITLSTGEKVTLKAYFTHKADRVFMETYRKDVVYERGDDGKLHTKQVPELNYGKAIEAVMLLMIESIEKAGNDVPATQAWLDDLKREDYKLLEEAVESLMNDHGDGKKKV